MKVSVNLNIALSLLRARLRQSLVAAAGVTFGIAAFTTLISFMTGLNKMLDGLVINRTPHVRIYNEIKPSEVQPLDLSPYYKGDINFISGIKPRGSRNAVRNNEEVIATLRADKRVAGVSPKTSAQVFFLSGNIEIAGMIHGVEIAEEERLFHLGDYVTQGRLSDLADQNNSIFIGQGIADKMMVEVGDMIQVATAKGELTQMKVVGIFQFGLSDLDASLSYASLSSIQKMLGQTASYITDVQVKLNDIADAPAMAKECERIFEADAIDIQTANAQFETGSTVRTTISFSVGITLLIVAGFGIYNILNMLIYEKLDSIAILKATGFSGRDVRIIFLSLSLIIGIAGGLTGLGVGYILSSIVDRIPFETQALPTIKTFPVNYNPLYYAIGFVFSLITTYIAGFFPARKAASVDPVIIIRGK